MFPIFFSGVASHCSYTQDGTTCWRPSGWTTSLITLPESGWCTEMQFRSILQFGRLAKTAVWGMVRVKVARDQSAPPQIIKLLFERRKERCQKKPRRPRACAPEHEVNPNQSKLKKGRGRWLRKREKTERKKKLLYSNPAPLLVREEN